jgi:probable HAF family extracellular repeat protein
MVDLGIFGGSGFESFATAVNERGQVVGASTPGPGQEFLHAFSWTEEGGLVDLGTLGGFGSQANAVNEGGQVVGGSSPAGENAVFEFHAFSWTEEGGMVDLGTLGGTLSTALAVNDHGQVVGWSDIAGDAERHAFSWTREGGLVDLGTLGGSFSLAVAVNDGGEAVGASAIPNGEHHAVVWRLSTTPEDTTPPMTTIALRPASPNGENGWYTSNVHATVSASDQAGGSGVAETRCVLDPASPPASFDDFPAGCAYTGAGAEITTDGVHTLYAASKDAAGNKETPVSATVRIDQTPPACTAEASPHTLWPPNHKLIPISVAVTVSDAGSGPNGFLLSSLTSSEPADPSDFQDWTTGTADASGLLRAARSGNGPGRTYSLTYTATDNAGNSTTCQTHITVPHDNRD